MMDKYCEFTRMVDLISTQNPLQKKRISSFINKQDENYWRYAEEICRKLNQSFFKDEQERAEAARSYNRMSMDFLREQIRFSKTGVYCVNDLDLARKNVYSNPNVMRYYMVGLLLSYLLWPNHFKILSFLRDHIKGISINKHLDIAPGHGLFTVEVLKRFPGIKSELLDISKTSIEVTNEILTAFNIKKSNYNFINGDFLTVSMEGSQFDFITMGEVLEHVNDAPGFLKRAADLLQPKGTIFMSTCANCPAIDHVYHFRDPDEIRLLIDGAGLSIMKEEVHLVDALPKQVCSKDLEASNYCAILVKK
jgi:2-polyprenyl-3-methyl-5-hydroxy-6-metoxy-1,4-benzoquinol methylase